MDKTNERRKFLQYAGAVSAALLAPPFAALPGAVRTAYAGALPVPDVEISLAAVPGEASVLRGRATEVWAYRAKVLKGDAARVQPFADSFLGPILRLRRGERVRIVFENGLEEPSNIHWHGLHVPEDMDGHPRHTAAPGKRYVYEFEVRDRAGTYWFHPHPHGRTGKQIYFGLAGLLLITDDEEQAARVPAGEYDLPLVLQDRTFDESNQLVFLPDRGTDGGRMGGMMGNMMG
ncbi:MAG: multicopper oxidase domain-containing protein, partial [Betaproteobacteria bacterium]|nr:multicopper oxidase domain-containing protein [Betaproteobacteria bacterium]